MISSILDAIFIFTLSVINSLGYWGIFILSALESANIPIPSEVILPFGGFLASEGSMNFWLVVFWGGFGNLVGSLVSYWIARRFSREEMLILGKYFLMSHHHLELAEKWFQKYGIYSVFIGRFVPVVRTFISFPAGMFKVPLKQFIVLTFTGSFLWSLFLAYLGFKLGENWTMLRGYFHELDYVILAVILALGAWWLASHLRRRRKHQ